jgi:septum formation protein
MLLPLMKSLVLASQSPRRQELLSILGIPFSVIPASINEVPFADEPAETFVVRMAREKGMEVASRITQSVILSADTIVTVDDEILGKPSDDADAGRMLRKLSGREHSVYTAVCVIDQPSGRTHEGLERTKVWFRSVSDEEIGEYLRRENVLDKAGAYGIQGYAGIYIPRLEGNYFNVMGLPLPLVHELLSRCSG